jgi:ABC-2 type transport system permease protein
VSLALATHKTDHPLKISILDDLGGLTPQITLELKDKLPNGKPLYQVVRTWDHPENAAAVRQELGKEVRDGHLDGFLELPKGILSGKEATFHALNTSDFQTNRILNRALTSAVIERRLSERGIHLENASEVMRGVELSLVKITKTGESEETGQSLLVQMFILMLIYFMLVVYGVVTMRSVLEEKTTRIVEMLVSSVKPSHLLAGKILGVAAVGLTQYLIWACTAALISGYGAAMAAAFSPGATAPRFHLPASYMVYPVIFFLVGYFLYASLYAAIGAMGSSEGDLQQTQIPVTLLIVVCVILYPIILRAPNSPLAVTLTLIPFFSPILMVFRITVQTPPFWQIALSLALCVATTVGLVQLSAKIYRVGILMYGKRPSLVELLRWLRYT